MRRVLFAVLALAAPAAAQQKRALSSTIAYISGVTVYINAGRLADVGEGDTAAVFHANLKIGSVVVTATADSSSAARILAQSENFRIGDTVTIMVSAPVKKHESLVASEGRPNTTEGGATSTPTDHPAMNVLSGTIALQYIMIAAEDSRLNLSQPAALIQMNVANLLGVGMSLRLYSVSFLNGNGAYALYGNRAGLENNVYQASLTGEVAGAGFGYGIGRLNSPYVSGLGTFDGGQVYYRISSFTFGVLGGAASSVPASSLSFSGTKNAAFVNYRSGRDVFHQFDGTVAYGLQMRNGQLDRNFLYLQNSLSLGSRLSFYETSEVDMSKPSDGTHVPGLSFSNTFFSINYFPTKWLFANVGYDAYRNVYLFQTMKYIPDSLIDRNILQGFRGSASAYLPGQITVSVNGSYRTRNGYARSEHTLGGSVRASDLLDLGIGGSIRYMNMTGVYSNANDLTLELDATLFYDLDVSLSYDSYDISVSLLQQTYTTQTISGFLDYSFSSRWFSSLGLDDVLDPSMNSFHVYAEIGVRF
jgi:hypothetical protein